MIGCANCGEPTHGVWCWRCDDSDFRLECERCGQRHSGEFGEHLCADCEEQDPCLPVMIWSRPVCRRGLTLAVTSVQGRVVAGAVLMPRRVELTRREVMALCNGRGEARAA